MAKIMMKNVRLSFPSLFSPATFNGEATKYEATLLINKTTQAELLDKLQDEIERLVKDNLKGVMPKPDKIALKDGDGVEYDGYEGHMSLKASNKTRPTVIDRDKSPLTEADGRPYAGCYVNAVVEGWVQNNSFGKRVNFNLLGIQFVKDGDRFGSGGVASADEFEDLGEGEDPFA